MRMAENWNKDSSAALLSETSGIMLKENKHYPPGIERLREYGKAT
jgi:hypothetical protein